MFSSFELFSAPRRVTRSRLRKAGEGSAENDEPTPTRLLRYLPLVVLATASVVLLPAALVATVVPRGNSLLMVASAVSAVAISVVIASAEAALWTRRAGSRDLVFADLMLWGWLRRCWTERRLAQARALYDSARKAGPAVSIKLLEDLSKRLEARDAYTHGHNQRVARHAERIARAMHLSVTEIAKIRTAATVHDVGKIYTPREILNNPGRLTEREYAIVKLHAGDGADMLAAVGDPEITNMVRHHHERIDGHGYPGGLAGSDIPLGARIIAVADTFDAITSSRAYRSAGTHKKALDILSQQAGSQLDGAAVSAFLGCYSARRSVAWFAFATVVPQRLFAALQTASPVIGASTGAITSILPALGAAGLLTLSPGLRHGTATERDTYRQPAVTQLHGLGVSANPTTDVARHLTRQTANIQLPQSQHRRSHRNVAITVPGPLSTPVSKNPKVSTPDTSADNGTDTREIVAVAPAAPPTKSSPAPTSPTPTPTPAPTPTPTPMPPPTAPPVEKSPTPSTPPISLPVTLPSIPNLPPVSVPGVSVSLPGVSISVPGITISTTKALGSKTP
ncbi:MAG TPA: HD-GYP domain-containing protein [Solirubrobacteraceae bacterium]|jgi:HD-GYP domain-containing protein (c-di-GMP phosphodiesterase class II)|nr:HD-GYP domain-containing protein [Solirubrobacteraceae bacterium]